MGAFRVAMEYIRTQKVLMLRPKISRARECHTTCQKGYHDPKGVSKLPLVVN